MFSLLSRICFIVFLVITYGIAVFYYFIFVFVVFFIVCFIVVFYYFYRHVRCIFIIIFLYCSYYCDLFFVLFISCFFSSGPMPVHSPIWPQRTRPLPAQLTQPACTLVFTTRPNGFCFSSLHVAWADSLHTSSPISMHERPITHAAKPARHQPRRTLFSCMASLYLADPYDRPHLQRDQGPAWLLPQAVFMPHSSS